MPTADLVASGVSTTATVIWAGTSQNGATLNADVLPYFMPLFTDPILLQVSNGEPVTVAAGFARSGQEAQADMIELYKEADEALYAAKSRQRLRHDDHQDQEADLAATGTFATPS